MRHISFKYSFFTVLLIVIASLAYNKRSTSAFIDYNEPGSYKVQALNIPTEIEFAGETIQLNESDLIERMDKELLVNTYWQSNTILMLKRAHKYFPQIEKILADEGVPEDFKYLALIESGLENCDIFRRSKGVLANYAHHWT